VEATAIGAVLGEGRTPANPIAIGSVKTNIGHSEAAAGIASLIKIALALHEGELPASLHFQEPNPRIPWKTLPITVQERRAPWPGAGRRLAGVNSFGITKTNAHLVVAQAPESRIVTPAIRGAGPAQLLTLSAHTGEALTALARAYIPLLSSGHG